MRALLIHAETPEAVAFYRRIDPGFEPSPIDPLQLILLIKDLRAALRDALRVRLDEVALATRPRPCSAAG